MLSKIKNIVRKIVPAGLFNKILLTYHFSLSLLGAIIYRFPGKKLHIVCITGTKGKSSTTEILSSIFDTAGYKTAVVGTVRFKIGNRIEPNLYKMTTPGRFFLQRFLRRAVNAGCTHAVIEMTSQAAIQFRHKFLFMNGLIFLNLSPEHIEAHGGYENYVNAKLSIAEELAKSNKKNKILVVNSDDKEANKFLSVDNIENKIKYNLNDGHPYTVGEKEDSITFKGVKINTHLRGIFNIYNMLGACVYSEKIGVKVPDIKKGLELIKIIPGRVELINCGQPFEVVVDYAHTADSLKKLYEAFPNKKKICLLGNTGGGRDTWKRPEMAAVADQFAEHIILTNEDPYDEDPMKILNDMIPGIKNKPYEIIIDRREAINKALKMAKDGSYVVLLTGKGTDPYIMAKNDEKIPWSDAKVAREELIKLGFDNTR